MKRTFKSLIAALMCLAISCSKEPMQNPLAASTQTIDNTTVQARKHFIGERFGGGIVFYLADTTGKHGLIADTVDLPPAFWWNGTHTVTGATAKGIGTGKENTLAILRAQGQPISAYYNYAAWECHKSVRSGYNDWFLPSRDELYELYKQKNVVGGLDTNGGYWNSSEFNDTNAWIQNFNDGPQFGNTKYYNNNV